MDQSITQGAATGFAVQAFGELRAEISLMRRAVERLTDERSSTPDYEPTLTAMSRRLEEVGGWAKTISSMPAMRLTPESLTAKIAEVASDGRRHEQELLDTAVRNMDASGSRIDALIARGRSSNDQNRELNTNRLAFSIAGMLLWSILPGAVARSLPVSWHVPERIAARMRGSSRWDAGSGMMSSQSPDGRNKLVKNAAAGAARQNAKSEW